MENKSQLTYIDIKSDHICDCINLLGMCCHYILHYNFRHKTCVMKDVQVILYFNFRHKTRVMKDVQIILYFNFRHKAHVVKHVHVIL